ncbi:helix-turn-helix domain-containing protein [Selenomonas ruminantium]|uniref:helix-turn-helix domain-containing protein n=1 Tax=Selenomonas ruminantium TaxID=971 RepID=UPI001568A4A2|nr:helix-turn-helix transcriptional regulator [Selenomonas ruminantium]
MIKLKELRKNKQLTQEELISQFNIRYGRKYTAAAISQFENGKRIPETQALMDFADFFNVSVDYLLGRTDEPQGTGFQKGLLGDTTQDSHIVMTSNTLGDSDTDDIQRRYSQLDEAGKAAVKNLMSIFENAKKTN